MADLDLQAVHDEMVATAYAAGEMMLAANPGDIDTDTKLNCEYYSEVDGYSLNELLTTFVAVDIVTETDKAVENMVSTRLVSAFPSFSFMGEETYKPGMRVGPEPTFVVDPIDG